MIGLVLCLALTFTSAAPPRKTLKEGNGCRLEDGEKGVCRKFTDCPKAVYELDTNFKWPLYCEFKDFDPIICCDEEKPTTETSTTSTTTTTTAATPERHPTKEYGKKSREKCLEYSEWLEEPTLFGAVKKAGICGIASEALIVGGENASAREFPHMVHLGYGDEDALSWRCGASLISEQYLLTAAHCLQTNDGSELTYARLGTGDASSLIYAKVAEKIPHPKYTPSRRYNDIALLKLAEPLTAFDDFMRPACLHTERRIGDKHALASGWGLTSYAGEASKNLLKVKLPLMTYDNCTKTYRKGINLDHGIEDKSMICAGGLALKKDTCNGDSGGPLQTIKKDINCMYSIVGITSFGINCGIAPGVYTRVSYYVPWIESIVWPDHD